MNAPNWTDRKDHPFHRISREEYEAQRAAEAMRQAEAHLEPDEDYDPEESPEDAKAEAEADDARADELRSRYGDEDED